jgi:hypothetical protein
MKNRSKFFAMLLTFGLCMGYAFAQTAAIKAVYRKGNNLFTIGADGQPKPLTDDSLSKGNPLWSKDGTKVAFQREIDKAIALDNLIVVDVETGKTLADIRICTVSPEVGCDVRYIEGIEWLTEEKIAAKGSINPSTVHTFVYDLKTGKEIADYLDDDGRTVFSPDGEHAADQTGKPHFTPESGAEPELDIDYLRVYPAKGIHVRLLSKPAWSEDSAKVAVVAEDYQSKQRSIVVCGLKGDCQSTALSTVKPDPDDRFRIQWKDGRVYVTFPEVLLAWEHGTVHETTWSLQPGDANAVASAPQPDMKPNPYDTPLSFQNKIQKLGGDASLNLLKQIQKLGGVEPDLWCQDCALAKLPRQAPK